MRAVPGLALVVTASALLVGLSRPAMAQCMGKGANRICIYEDGVWTPAGFIPFPEKPSGPSKYPNAASSGPRGSRAPTTAATTGETVVLQPSAETGNAWVLAPQSNSDGATCGQGTRCD